MVTHLQTQTEFEQRLKTDENNEVIGLFDGMELRSVFQPIYRADQTVLGFEALIRANRLDGASVCPSFLFRKLEQTDPGYIDQVSIDMLARVIHLRNFAPYSGRHAIFLNILPSSAVISTSVLGNQTLMMKRLQELGILRDQVVLEVVEHCYDDADSLTKAAAISIANGFRIAIDDYGVEGSHEARVRMIKPSVLKVDRSLLQRYMGGDIQPLLDAISLAKDVDAAVLVEGIESQQEYDAMRALRVDYFQGFYLGMPQSIHGFFKNNPHEICTNRSCRLTADAC